MTTITLYQDNTYKIMRTETKSGATFTDIYCRKCGRYIFPRLKAWVGCKKEIPDRMRTLYRLFE